MEVVTCLNEFDVAVTQDDIDSGVRGNPEKCALACAMYRQMPDLDDPAVSVEPDEVNILGYDSDGMLVDYQFSLSDDICEFIEGFDDDKRVKPLEIKMIARKVESDENTISFHGRGFVPSEDD